MPVMTGDSSPHLDVRAGHLGAFGLIHKPINLPALLKLIDVATGGQSSGSGDSLDESEPKEIKTSAQTCKAKISGLR